MSSEDFPMCRKFAIRPQLAMPRRAITIPSFSR